MKNVRNSLWRVVNVLVSLSSQGLTISVILFAIIALFLVPLPPAILDLLIAANIVIALVLLLRGVYLQDPVRLYSFPTILLFTTLFRLALNVSSTRLILLNGDQGKDAAGSVIASFGKFVAGDDFVVGAIIFSVIAIVNFVVIAKGSARVAEVSARFALDALPGKQLAIDSDVRSGRISPDQAAIRRDELMRESQFYGAMDGSMKFVQGDAIAGFVITFINAIGGVSIGLSRGLGFSEAVNNFGVLTIGDGLVSILPSLLISVCAGIVVTHVKDPASTSSSMQMMRQVIAEPQSVVIAALAVVVLSVIPGIPFLPFFLVGSMLLIWAGAEWATASESKLATTGSLQNALPLSSVRVDDERGLGWTGEYGLPAQIKSAASDSASARAVISYFSVRALTLEVDAGSLATYLGTEGNEAKNLRGYFNMLRDERYRKRGVLVPDLQLVVNQSLPPNRYRVLVRERVVREGLIQPEELFVVANESLLASTGIQSLNSAVHPLNGRSANWVHNSEGGIRSLEHLGVEVLRPYQFLCLEAIGAAFEYAVELFGVDEIKSILELIKNDHATLIQEVFDKEIVSFAEFGEMARRLIREHVSVRDLKIILEGILEYHTLHPEFEDRAEWLAGLHGFLRLVLSRSIIADSIGPSGQLRTFVLSPEVEQEFRAAVSAWDEPRTKLPLEPDTELALRNSARVIFSPVLERGALPIVVLCPGEIRRAVQEFFDSQPGKPEWFRAIAFEELDSSHRPASVGVLTVR